MNMKHTPWDTRGPQGNFRRTLADFRQTLGHLTTCLVGNPKLPRGTQQLTEHKERIPGDLTRSFNDLVQRMQNEITDPVLREKVVNILQTGKPDPRDENDSNDPLDKCSGVRVILTNARLAHNLLERDVMTPEYDPSNRAYAEQISGFIRGINQRWDDAHLRFGNEVVFQGGDFPEDQQV